MVMIKIKEFLKKIKKYEFKTDAGLINLVFGLGIMVLFGGLEIFTSLKAFLWRLLFHMDLMSYDVPKLIILIPIYFIISIFIVMLGEK